MDLPATFPPPGVTPNFDHPYDSIYISGILNALTVFVPTLVVGLRLYCKLVVKRNVGHDDVVLCVGWLATMMYCGFTIRLAYLGVARHLWNIRLVELPPILHATYAAIVLYNFIVPLIKTVILLQYISIFCPKNEKNFMFWSCWALIVGMWIFFGEFVFQQIYACTPVRKFWIPWMEGSCRKYSAYYIATGVVNMVTDVIIIVLPQRSIWRLNMSRRKKLRASGIFLISLFALVASVMRLYFTVRADRYLDKTYDLNLMGSWTFAEFNTTFVCSCLPSLAQLATHWKPKFIAMTKNLSWTSGWPTIMSKLHARSADDGTTGVHVKRTATIKRGEGYIITETEVFTHHPNADTSAASLVHDTLGRV